MNHRAHLVLALLACLAVPVASSCAAPPADAEPTAPADSGEAAAVVGDRTISMAELREAAATDLAELRAKEYEVLRGYLENMIGNTLLEQEAARRGVEVQAMLDQEVGSKTPEVTDAEVDAFYEQNKDQIRQPKEQIYEPMRQNLVRRKQAEIFRQFIEEIRGRTQVSVSLDPPRTDVAVDDDPSWGPEAAPVTIIEFSDFECPFCSRVVPTLAAIRERYGDKVRIVYRDYPLNFHPNAQKAAEAAQCADEQGKFWDYHDKLFANQKALAVDQLKAHAAALELDAEAFGQCLDSGKYAAEVQADFEAGAAAGVTGTPAFFINGRFVNGALPLENFIEIIEEELARLAPATSES